MASSLKVASFNVRGLNEEKKRRKIFNLLHEEKADIILLQETHSTRKVQKIWRNEWGGTIFFSHYNSRSRGVAILIRRGFDYKLCDSFLGPDGRVIILQIQVEELKFVIANIYAPNEEDIDFFHRTFKKVADFGNPYTMISGDFNMVFDVDKDRMGACAPDNKGNVRKVVLQYMADLEMVDLWREFHPDKNRYTCFSRIPHLVCSRIDHILLSAAFCQFCISMDIGSAYISDHSPLKAAFNIAQNPRGRGYWKFNNSLLLDKDYCNLIEAVIKETLSQRQQETAITTWETIKVRICAETVSYSINKKKGKENKLDALVTKLQHIQDTLHSCYTQSAFTNRNEILEQMTLIQKDIDDILEAKTEGCIVRSRATWHEFGEKMSSYFFALEKHNQQKKKSDACDVTK